MQRSLLATDWNETRDQPWRSLSLLGGYRLFSALLLLVVGGWYATVGGIRTERMLPYLALAFAYLSLALGMATFARDYRAGFHLQLSVQLMVDVTMITALGFLLGGLGSGIPLLVLVSMAGAALIGRGRLVMFYAAYASMALLFAQTLAILDGRASVSDYFQAGVLAAAYFAIAVVSHRLAGMLRTKEALVRQQALDLANLAEVNEAVLNAMQDAVLVVDFANRIRLANPRAVELLGPPPPVPGGALLAGYCRELDQHLQHWRQQPRPLPQGTLRAAVTGRELRPRFFGIGGEARQGVSIFLEDVTDAQAQARQGKLAALGRLTANIAHEIRNPLAAISHAAELLAEDHPRDPVEQKLIRIISDNTVRLNRLVNEVLQLNRRDRAQPEVIDATRWFAEWRETFCAGQRIPMEWISLELASDVQLHFDRNHLHQVLWNLVCNALRYCRHQPGSIRLCLDRAPGAQVLQLDVLDDGAGVPEDQVGKLFEPFFTTDSQGTGLGLYIARELCVANGATLDYVEFAPGAQFRLLLRAH